MKVTNPLAYYDATIITTVKGFIVQGPAVLYKTFCDSKCCFFCKKAVVFATSIHFHPSLIVLGKARSLPLDCSPVRGSTLVALPIITRSAGKRQTL
jgi:hypothetical protein